MCSVVELVVKLGDVGKALVFISIKYALYSLGKVENVLTVENFSQDSRTTEYTV